MGLGWVWVHVSSRARAPTCPKDVIDQVNNLLAGDEVAIHMGALFTVLEQGTGDVLDMVLRGHMFEVSPRTKAGPSPSPPRKSLWARKGTWQK